MRSPLLSLGIALLSILLAAPVAAQVPPKGPYTPGQVGSKPPGGTADHGKFEVLKQDFKSGPEVTKACLTCHTEAAHQFMKSIHWTWDFKNPRTGQQLGKKTVINDFCGSVASNEPRCTSCHAGYGWKDNSFDFTKQENVDCLICHDRSATYWKHPTMAGNPLPASIVKDGKVVMPAPDLAKAAQSVGLPGRENCGACHFYSGGGDGVKSGNLDSSLARPTKGTDVHMDASGLNFACSACHVTREHTWPGSRYDVHAVDQKGAPKPGMRRDVATCESCHGNRPHKGWSVVDMRLNSHTSKVACQTCHIPAFARGGVPTKTVWDWSQAGKLRDGKPYVVKNDAGQSIYESIKGAFEWGANVKPEYFWFDGQMLYSNADKAFDPKKPPVPINAISGSYADPKSRIWPFKVMRGRQPYDAATNTLVYTHVFGQTDDAYWRGFNWERAITEGQKTAGRSFSGRYDFIDTVMYWPQTHMVAPAKDAVKCGHCHRKDGRLEHVAGFYLPGRDANPWVNRIGYTLVVLALAGVVISALLRLVFRRRKDASA